MPKPKEEQKKSEPAPEDDGFVVEQTRAQKKEQKLHAKQSEIYT